jgi:hypothetical protein
MSLASSPAMAEMRKASRERRRRKQKREDSALVGGSARQGGRDLLFRKVSRLSLSQRAVSLRQKPNRRRDPASLRVLKFASWSSSRGREELEAEPFGRFRGFFRISWIKNRRRWTNPSWFLCSARMVGERKEFLTTPSRSSSLCLLPLSHSFGIARSRPIGSPGFPARPFRSTSGVGNASMFSFKV